MISHLTFASQWVECDNPDGCENVAHLEAESETLNSSPREWVEALLPEYEINDKEIIRYNSAGYYHNEDGPAIERSDGTKEWYLHGKEHRVDGPAIIRANGTRCWCVNGKFHREDGPAVEYANGDKQWWLNGVRQLQTSTVNSKKGYS